jgi:hypothetical protein
MTEQELLHDPQYRTLRDRYKDNCERVGGRLRPAIFSSYAFVLLLERLHNSFVAVTEYAKEHLKKR